MYQFLVALSLISSVLTAPAADLVNNLPGLTFNPSFKHYSGYDQAASTRYFHYWYEIVTFYQKSQNGTILGLPNP